MSNEKLNKSRNDENETEEDDDDDSSTNKQQSKNFLKSLKSFTKRIKTLADEEEANEFDLTCQTIEYGNLTKNYDPIESITKTTKDELLTQNLMLVEDDEDYSYKVYCSLFNENKTESKINTLNTTLNSNTTPIKNQVNFNEINLIRKASLLKLIERNRLNQICCPFDEIVYENLTYETSKLPPELVESKRTKAKLDLKNSIRKFEYTQFELKGNSIDYLMPNCVATFLMQFFFDIFPPSELKQLSPSILEILLKLKSSFKPQIHLDSNLKLTHLLEDILWNCFALFKYKFDKSFKIGFINYYQSLFTILNFYKEDAYFKKLNLATGIRQLAPYYIEALILNGLFDHNDFKAYSKLVSLEENDILEEAFKIIDTKMKRINQPMKLKHMCRFRLKQVMKKFNSTSLDSLNISESLKSFIMFNSEFESYYNENKRILFNLNN